MAVYMYVNAHFMFYTLLKKWKTDLLDFFFIDDIVGK